MSTLPISTPRPVAVVVQTHWDREWYFDHQTYVARLLDVMARVVAQLERGDLEQFLFDGQTAAYEDLMANSEPLLAERVQALVSAGRIVLGPWYVMADEFLVSGESLLRNLEIGMADANAAGNCQRVGYLPDTFGHVGQMPQLLRNVGIESAVLWRGLDSPVAEWQWQAPSGHEVGGILLTEGYYQHPLNVPDWQAALEKYLDTIAPRSLADELLLTQGGDHLVPGAEVGARIAAFNASQTRWALKQTTLADHVARALAQTEGRRVVRRGQLRDNARAFVLPDVLSTRRYLKRLNQAAEDRMSLVEALWAQLDTSGTEYPARYLRDTWRLIIQNQAHDSICGCSIDTVHDEMVTRYREIDSRLDALWQRARAAVGMLSTAHHQAAESALGASVFADDSVCTLWNPLPFARDDAQIVHVFIKGPRYAKLKVTPADVPAGRELAFSAILLSATPHAELQSPIDEFPEKLEGWRYELLIQTPLAAQQAMVLHVEGVEPMTINAASPQPTLTRQIENAALAIRVLADSTIEIHDKRSGRVHTGVFALQSELDAGDTYNFSPPPLPHKVRQETWILQDVSQTDGFAEMRLATTLSVPVGLFADRHGRHPDSVDIAVELRIRLLGDADRIECELRVDNTARDHRLRVLLPLDANVATTFADSAFEWCHYPVKLAEIPAKPSRREMPVVVNPSLRAIHAGPWTIAHRAMHEYEIVADETAGTDTKSERALAITLLRCVGWMSRRDLVTRGVGAGPDLETPGAQCLGTEVFVFQLGLPADSREHPLAAAQRWRVPVQLIRGQTPRWRDPIDLGNANLQVSSVRQAGAELELRCWNPTDAPISIRPDALRDWRRVFADGRDWSGLTPDAAPHVVGAVEIATFRRRQ
jgi:mannosylglycerate hydrolase